MISIDLVQFSGGIDGEGHTVVNFITVAHGSILSFGKTDCPVRVKHETRGASGASITAKLIR